MTPKILKYRIVTHEEVPPNGYGLRLPEQVQAYVQSLIDQGWQPYGYPRHRSLHTFDAEFEQVMVIYEEIKKP